MDYGKKVRIGNFSLLKYRKGEESFVRAAAISGEWAMEWGMFSPMFSVFDSLESDDDLQGASVFVTMVFVASGMLDAGFIHDVFRAAQECVERRKKLATDEENEEIMSEIDELEDMVERYKDFADEHDGGEGEGGS